jgi:hypothetical protein
MTRAKILVELFDEGVPVWRPVEAEALGGARYRLPVVDLKQLAEVWAFAPGSVVECEIRVFSGGPALVAVRLADGPHARSIDPPDLDDADLEFLIALTAWEEGFIFELPGELGVARNDPDAQATAIARMLPILSALMADGLVTLARSKRDGTDAEPWPHKMQVPEDLRTSGSWLWPARPAPGTKHWQLVHAGGEQAGRGLSAVSKERAQYLMFGRGKSGTRV